METPKADLVEYKFENGQEEEFTHSTYGRVVRYAPSDEQITQCVGDLVSAFSEDFKDMEKENVIPSVRYWFRTKFSSLSNMKNNIERKVVEELKKKGYPDGVPVSSNPFEKKDLPKFSAKNRESKSAHFKTFLNPFLEQLGKLSAWIVIGVIVIFVLFLVGIFFPSLFEFLEKISEWFR